jgi:hypothetical protein
LPIAINAHRTASAPLTRILMSRSINICLVPSKPPHKAQRLQAPDPAPS